MPCRRLPRCLLLGLLAGLPLWLAAQWPALPMPPQGEAHSLSGQVCWLDTAMRMPQLGQARRIWAYLPQGYAREGAQRYPVLYMHDAQNLFDRAQSYAGEWGIDESLLAAEAAGLPVPIVIGIEHGGAARLDELTPYAHPRYGGGQGAAYCAFIVETLKPRVDSLLRTLPGPAHTGIMGSSLGGLLSVYAAARHPDVFGRVGVFSPSLWFSARIYADVAAMRPPGDSRWYIVAGHRESAGLVDEVRQLRAELLQRGLPRSAVALRTHADGEHREWYWQREFPAALAFLFGPAPGPVEVSHPETPQIWAEDGTLYLIGAAPLRRLALVRADGRRYPLLPRPYAPLAPLPPGPYTLFWENEQGKRGLYPLSIPQ